MRPKIKVEYQGRTFVGAVRMFPPIGMRWQIADDFPHAIALRVTFIATGAQGIMYVRPDALPCKYGME